MTIEINTSLSREDILQAVEEFKGTLENAAQAIDTFDPDTLSSLRAAINQLLEKAESIPPFSGSSELLILALFAEMAAQKNAYINILKDLNYQSGQNSHTSGKPPRTDGYHRGEDAFGKPRSKKHKKDDDTGSSKNENSEDNDSSLKEEDKNQDNDQKPVEDPEDNSDVEESENDPASEIGNETTSSELPIVNEYGETAEEYLARTNKKRSLRGLADIESNNPDTPDYHRGCTMPEDATLLDPVYHIPEKCKNCDKWETCKANAWNVLTRNVLNVKVTFIVESHIVQAVACPEDKEDGGILVSGDFPDTVNSSMQYGANVKAMTLMLTAYGFTSWEKARTIMGSFLGRSMGKGCIESFNAEFASNVTETVERIKNALWIANVVCLDETGCRADSKLVWVHSACNTLFTYISMQHKRGAEGMSAAGFLDFYENKFVTDAWKPYMNLSKEEHALCNGHSLRELLGVALFFDEDTTWSSNLIELMLNMNHKRNELINQGIDAFPQEEKEEFYRKYDNALDEGFALHPMPQKTPGKRGAPAKGKVLNLLIRLRESKQCYCMFVEDFSIPFTNNTAEQSFRSVAEKMGISQCFKTWDGAVDFMISWSYISTCIKHKLPILDALVAGFEGNSTEFLFGTNPPERPESVRKAMKKAEEARKLAKNADQEGVEETETDDPYGHLDKVVLDKLIPLAKKHGLTRGQFGNKTYLISELEAARKAQAEKSKCDKEKRRAESEAKRREREERKQVSFKDRLDAFKSGILEAAKEKVEKFKKKYGRNVRNPSDTSALTNSQATV